MPSSSSSPSGGSKVRQIASALDTALLVFFVLLVLAVAWWVLKAVVGTVVFFGKLAVLAILITLAVRTYLVVRNRLRRPPRSHPL